MYVFSNSLESSLHVNLPKVPQYGFLPTEIFNPSCSYPPKKNTCLCNIIESWVVGFRVQLPRMDILDTGRILGKTILVLVEKALFHAQP
jgi:hypothetical protein